MPLAHEHKENQLPKFRIKIQQKDRPGMNRIITQEGHNRDEAKETVAGMYPNHEIVWVE